MSSHHDPPLSQTFFRVSTSVGKKGKEDSLSQPFVSSFHPAPVLYCCESGMKKVWDEEEEERIISFLSIALNDVDRPSFSYPPTAFFFPGERRVGEIFGVYPRIK